MTRDELILAALSAAGGGTFSPVQVQKLFFLIDQRIPGLIGGPYFDFEPYDYGPFDPAVYSELEGLADRGCVEIISDQNLRWKKYRLTAKGLIAGTELFNQLGPETSSYISTLVQFVRRLSFAELVAAIYKEYPEMKVNSVFRQ